MLGRCPTPYGHLAPPTGADRSSELPVALRLRRVKMISARDSDNPTCALVRVWGYTL